MAAFTTPPEEPDKVGPGNPPHEYRWKKGCPSPNPGGRPRTRDREKMLEDLDPDAAMVVKVAEQLLADNSISVRELALRQLAGIVVAKPGKVTDSVRLAAIKLFFEYDARARKVLAAEKERQFHAAMDFKEYWTPRFRRWEKEGRGPSKVLPHPDDVVIHSDGTAEFVGPVTPAQQAAVEIALIHRGFISDCYKDGDVLPVGAEGTLRSLRRRWNKLNKAVPPRLRLPFPKVTVAIE